MVHYIENEYFRVGVKEAGCELTSIYSKKATFEYLCKVMKAYGTVRHPFSSPL